jgi:hypothetical protein
MQTRKRLKGRAQARLCHTCGNTEHILLGNTDIEEPVREFLTEHADFCRFAQVSGESDHSGCCSPSSTKSLAVIFRR